MTGNPLSEVQTYFGIDPDNGDIFLRELLTNPPRQSYQVITRTFAHFICLFEPFWL